MNAVSAKAATLIGSEIIRLAGEINQKIKAGEQIFNLTIGDFNPKLFPIPEALRNYIIEAYEAGETNYPPADGMPELKKAIARFISRYEMLDFAQDEIMVSGGGRPLIYAIYQTIVDKDDKVLYPVPSWNNNHYCHLSDACRVEVETTAEHAFMPTAEELAPHIGDAVMLALCSPLNPTGTTFKKDQLAAICRMVVNENARRAGRQKPLYVLYDQIYWMLHAEGTEHFNPVSIDPRMKEYTIFVDGISKSLSATGVRVGWALGPANVISRMKSILGHIGAWAPKAEQVATARFLDDDNALGQYLETLKEKINLRFRLVFEGFNELKRKGLPVDIIMPEGAIYLTVRFALTGKRMADGKVISGTEDITAFLLNEARLAVVPFTAFGCGPGTDWYRLSIGTLDEQDVPAMLAKLELALGKLES